MKDSYLEELAALRQQVNALFDRVMVASNMAGEAPGTPGTWTPPIDVHETEDAFVLLAELPGVLQDEVDLSVVDGRLELAGRRGGSEEGTFLRMEGSYGPFRRAVEFNQPVDLEDISASYRLGLLRIAVPKRSGSGRQVPVTEED